MAFFSYDCIIVLFAIVFIMLWMDYECLLFLSSFLIFYCFFIFIRKIKNPTADNLIPDMIEFIPLYDLSYDSDYQNDAHLYD